MFLLCSAQIPGFSNCFFLIDDCTKILWSGEVFRRCAWFTRASLYFLFFYFFIAPPNFISYKTTSLHKNSRNPIFERTTKIFFVCCFVMRAVLIKKYFRFVSIGDRRMENVADKNFANKFFFGASGNTKNAFFYSTALSHDTENI